jgi:heptaprenylglyceryl phosphate synthase
MAVSNIDKQLFGQAGATFLSGTENTTREVCSILFLADSVLSSTNTSWPELTEGTAKNLIGDTSTQVIPNGVTIVGQFSKVGLDSGAALCYHPA